jgi:phosphatidylglycerol:prolipoprotein diacylglycerol transferase
MSQTPADSTARHGTTPPCTVAFGLGGLTGSSYQLYYPPNVGCGSNIQKNIKDFEGYKQRFTGATASASYEVPLKAPGRTVLRVGLNWFLGQTSFAPLVLNVSTASGGDSILVLQQASRRLLYDFNPNVEFFKKGSPGHSLHLRLGFGLHLSHRAAYDFVTEPLRNRKIVPSAVMEIGYRNIFWTHTSLYQRWDAVGNGTARLGFGTGFGLDNLTVLGGWAYSNSNGQLSNNYGFLGQPPFKAPTSAFVDVQWQISPTWGVEASSLSNFNDVTQSSLGVKYRLPLLKK